MPTTADRRRHPRVTTHLNATVRFDSPTIAAATVNASSNGLYFVANGPLTVEVALNIDGQMRVVKGRLVRIDSQTASHDSLGIVVKLDKELVDVVPGKKPKTAK
ncbi:MAG: PilZ domain-containing protein [Planctomycetota bacterium]